MKKYIKAHNESIQKIDIIAEIEFEYKYDLDIAATTHKGFDVPEGELLPSEKEAILSSQALADYYAFIESMEDLMTDYYGLHIYYKNSSKSNSFYYGMLAKDNEGNIILDFDFTLRVSNHNPHRSKESQYNKKQRKIALENISKGKILKPITKQVVVNKDNFDDYEDAYLEVDSIIENAVTKMKRRLSRNKE